MRLADPNLDRLLDVVVEAVVDRLLGEGPSEATPKTETPERLSLRSGVVVSHHGDVGGLNAELYAAADTPATAGHR